MGPLVCLGMAGASGPGPVDDVSFTHLDEPLFDGSRSATKRDLVDYLDGVSDRVILELQDRPLSVVRVHRGEEAFMQKNVPKYTPAWVKTVPFWAEASKREVTYARSVTTGARCFGSPTSGQWSTT